MSLVSSIEIETPVLLDDQVSMVVYVPLFTFCNSILMLNDILLAAIKFADEVELRIIGLLSQYANIFLSVYDIGVATITEYSSVLINLLIVGS